MSKYACIEVKGLSRKEILKRAMEAHCYISKICIKCGMLLFRQDAISEDAEFLESCDYCGLPDCDRQFCTI